jgi:hypothetical protein
MGGRRVEVIQDDPRGEDGAEGDLSEVTAGQLRFLSALLASPSIVAASAASGIPYGTCKRWVLDPAFVALLERAKREMLAVTSLKAQQLAGKAVDTLGDILEDEHAPAAARVAAARAILEHAGSLREQELIIKKVRQLQEATVQRIRDSGWHPALIAKYPHLLDS